VLREQGVQAAPRTYRAWKRTAASARAVSDAAIVDRLRQLRTGEPGGRPLPEVLYGRRKMTAWLARTGFPGVSKHTVDRLMRQEGMRGLVRGPPTRRRHESRDGSPVCRCRSNGIGFGPRYGRSDEHTGFA
jgi:putative transposase